MPRWTVLCRVARSRIAVSAIVIAWSGPSTLQSADYCQMALKLTGHARPAVAAELRRRCTALPPEAEPVSWLR